MASAPYAADTRAKGWRFELDHERIRQSDTWTLTPSEYRPWLLMLWMVAWEQTPCGSLPDDDSLICARIGMSPKAYAKAREALMRGWWKADDGRLYHKVITERVLAMLEYRRKEAERKGKNRGRTPEDKRSPAPVPRDNHGTDGTGTGTSSSVPYGTGGEPPSDSPSLQDNIFGYGVPLLTSSGTPEKQARSFIGKLRSGYQDQQVMDAIRACIKAQAAQPMEYIAKLLPAKDAPKKVPWHETQSGVETMGIKLGLGMWVQTEQWPIYKARVMAAHSKGAH
jgi:uncharacterized protein YdaU (DUF1376 family)